jgi:hypothetical protein
LEATVEGCPPTYEFDSRQFESGGWPAEDRAALVGVQQVKSSKAQRFALALPSLTSDPILIGMDRDASCCTDEDQNESSDNPTRRHD